MNIILCQRKLKDIGLEWKVYSSYIGECDNVIVLIFDKNDIVNVQSIKYNSLFVIIANTPQRTVENIGALISLSKLVFGCSNSDIYLETEEYPFTSVLEDIEKKLRPNYGFWLTLTMLFGTLLFLSCVILATMYNALSQNQ